MEERLVCLSFRHHFLSAVAVAIAFVLLFIEPSSGCIIIHTKQMPFHIQTCMRSPLR